MKLYASVGPLSVTMRSCVPAGETLPAFAGSGPRLATGPSSLASPVVERGPVVAVERHVRIGFAQPARPQCDSCVSSMLPECGAASRACAAAALPRKALAMTDTALIEAATHLEGLAVPGGAAARQALSRRQARRRAGGVRDRLRPLGPAAHRHLPGSAAHHARCAARTRVLTGGAPTRLIAFSDDMDGLRKVPDNVPNQALMLRATSGRSR